MVLDFIKLTETITRKMPITDGKTFEDEVVYIDFNDYRNCIFKKCTIILEYGICRMDNITFDACNFEGKMGSPASFAIQMERSLREAAELEKHK